MGKKSQRRPEWFNDDEIHAWAKSTGRKDFTGNRSRDTMVSAEDRKAFYKAQMNNYDTRKAMETFNLAKQDEEFAKSLGSKMRNFVKDYESRDKKEGFGGITGISSSEELETIRNFQEKYRKHKRNMGGHFISERADNNDMGDNTQDMIDMMRKHHLRNFATKDEINHEELNEKKPENITVQDRDVPVSPELEAARDKIKEQPRDIYDFNNANERPPEVDNAQNAANSFLNDYRERINSTRPKSNELQAAVNRLNSSISV